MVRDYGFKLQDGRKLHASELESVTILDFYQITKLNKYNFEKINELYYLMRDKLIYIFSCFHALNQRSEERNETCVISKDFLLCML